MASELPGVLSGHLAIHRSQPPVPLNAAQEADMSITLVLRSIRYFFRVSLRKSIKKLTRSIFWIRHTCACVIKVVCKMTKLVIRVQIEMLKGHLDLMDLRAVLLAFKATYYKAVSDASEDRRNSEYSEWANSYY